MNNFQRRFENLYLTYSKMIEADEAAMTQDAMRLSAKLVEEASVILSISKDIKRHYEEGIPFVKNENQYIFFGDERNI